MSNCLMPQRHRQLHSMLCLNADKGRCASDGTDSTPRCWFDRMTLRPNVLIVSSLLVAVALSSCTTAKGGGGLFSRKPSASAAFITALQGGIAGRSGVQLSDSDKQRALEAEYRALEGAAVGQPVVWSGRNVSGKVVAAAPYQVGSQNCRQYTHTLTADSKDTIARGAACRNSDGSWSPLG
ncbi:surface antigen [Rhizobium sullae]|uniref:Surface antigen n=2 Tax=Rhizobium sullae TaxID=50338 RepID=A0A4R3QEE3_RHISU|nr:surface antigen [Rhizobium sullae]